MKGASPTTVEQIAARFETDLEVLIDELRLQGQPYSLATADFLDRIVRAAFSRGATMRTTMSIMFRLPLLVHGVETGDPLPAKRIGIVHILWWTAARFLDDLADSAASVPADTITVNKEILASFVAGSFLPMRLITDAEIRPAMMMSLYSELSRGWTDAISGQLMDFDHKPESATPESVLLSYRGKTGAAYAMACAMASTLAGADPDRTDRWRDLGARLGIIRQLLNDQRDLASGRDEDLANGTATYLLSYFLSSLTPDRKKEALDLHSSAARSASARHRLREQLLAPEVISGYVESINVMVGDFHRALDDLGGNQEYAVELHALMNETMAQSPSLFAGAGGG